MFRIALLLSLCAAAGLPAENHSSEPKNQAAIFIGNVLPQIAAGSGWSTEIQVMHSRFEDVAEAFTINFYDNSGNALSIPVTGLGNAPVPGVSGLLQPRGAAFFVLEADPGAPLLEGFALIESTTPGGATMNAVLTQKVDGRPDFQASIPSLDQNGTNFQFPFRNDGASTTTVAFVSSANQSITAVARRLDGLELCFQTWQMGAGQHEAFLVSDRLPCSAGKGGVVEIVPEHSGAMIAFLFNDFGAFTTQLPFEIVGDE
jgi:hypothetical protein